MKNTLITLIAVLFTGACATTPIPTVKSVAGIYENSVPNVGIWKLLLMKNGEWEEYKEGSTDKDEGHWKIVDGEIHKKHRDDLIATYRINEDGSITHTAFLIGGKRKETPRDKQPTSIKLN